MRVLWMMLVASLAFAGCVDDADATEDSPAPSEPWYTGETGEWEPATSATRFGDVHALELPGVGNGIWIEEGILVHTNGADLHVVDARDPTNMTVIGELPDLPGARDVDILNWNGLRYALVAGSGNGMHIIDITEPTNPQLVVTAPVLNAGVHNLAAVDGTPYVYVSGASGNARRIDYVDISDPTDPQVGFFTMPATMTVNGVPNVPLESDGCHDIAVRVDLERAYCAGGGGVYYGAGGETFIWDISDAAGGPTNPTWISAMDDPRIKYHHQVFPNDDGTILIINDEYVGPFLPGVPVGANNCFDFPETPLPDNVDSGIPLAAAWIYDISDESAPQQLSYVQNPSGWNGEGVPPNPLEGNCGAHFGDMIPGQDAFIMAWYEGGTILVDFSEPTTPAVLDIAPEVEGETWDAMYYGGYVFHASGDLFATELL